MNDDTNYFLQVEDSINVATIKSIRKFNNNKDDVFPDIKFKKTYNKISKYEESSSQEYLKKILFINYLLLGIKLNFGEILILEILPILKDL